MTAGLGRRGRGGAVGGVRGAQEVLEDRYLQWNKKLQPNVSQSYVQIVGVLLSLVTFLYFQNYLTMSMDSF